MDERVVLFAEAGQILQYGAATLLSELDVVTLGRKAPAAWNAASEAVPVKDFLLELRAVGPVALFLRNRGRVRRGEVRGVLDESLCAGFLTKPSYRPCLFRRDPSAATWRA